MEVTTFLLTLVSIGVVLPVGSQAQLGEYPYNPKPFQKLVVSPSEPVRFLYSERGQTLLRNSPDSRIRQMLQRIGVSPGHGPFPDAPEPELPDLVMTLGVNCGTSSGTVFNLEPATNALPQDSESVDVLLGAGISSFDLVVGGSNDFRGFFGGLGGSVTGYYIQRANNVCAPEAEGGLPTIPNPFNSAEHVFGGGDPVIAADTDRSAFYAADLRFTNTTVTGIGVFRNTAANLTNTTNCPNGTHTAAQAATCWGKGIIVAAEVGGLASSNFIDKPHLAVDQRATGIGAGNVYITGTQLTATTAAIFIVTCTNSLSSCSAPKTISGSDVSTQFSHVTVRPDGKVVITYVNVTSSSSGAQVFRIRYASCTPAAAPASPTCGSASTVFVENKPLAFGTGMEGASFRIATYPKHDERMDSSGAIQTVVVWDRCKVGPILFGSAFLGPACPDADVFFSTTSNDGSTWSTPSSVASTSQNEFFPWIKTDVSKNITNIVYYSSVDSVHHRLQLFMKQITAAGLSSAFALTTVPDEPDDDPIIGGTIFGDYIGLAARGTSVTGQSRAYPSFTYNTRLGTYGGIHVGQQDNFLSMETY